MEIANFGTVLREARERRQVSLAEVAQRTKVSANSLRLLEAGNLDDLPPEIFVRGFIRSYARTVGISHGEPLSLLDEALAERRRASEAQMPVLPARRVRAAVPSPAEPSTDDEGQPQRRGIGLAVFVIIVLLIATITLSLFLRQQPPSGEGLSLDQRSTGAGQSSTVES